MQDFSHQLYQPLSPSTTLPPFVLVSFTHRDFVEPGGNWKWKTTSGGVHAWGGRTAHIWELGLGHDSFNSWCGSNVDIYIYFFFKFYIYVYYIIIFCLGVQWAENSFAIGASETSHKVGKRCSYVPIVEHLRKELIPSSWAYLWMKLLFDGPIFKYVSSLTVDTNQAKGRDR